MLRNQKANRRDFVKQLGAIGSAAMVTAAIPERAWGYRSSLNRPKFASIGLRNQGWAITSKTLPFADFVALAVWIAESWMKMSPGWKKHKDESQMLMRIIARSWTAKISTPL